MGLKFFSAAALLSAGLLAMTTAAAAYVVEPAIASECADLKAKVEKQTNSPSLLFDYAVCLSRMGEVEESNAKLKAVQRLDGDFKRKALPMYLERYKQMPDDPRRAYQLGFVF